MYGASFSLVVHGDDQQPCVAAVEVSVKRMASVHDDMAVFMHDECSRVLAARCFSSVIPAALVACVGILDFRFLTN